MIEQEETQTNRERLSKVFEFLKAYVELRNPPVRDIERELKILWLRDIPEHPSVEVICGDVDIDQESEDADIVLRIARPELHGCPPPPKAIAGWVNADWDNIDSGGGFLASRNIFDRGGSSKFERFEDVPERVLIGGQWRRERNAWQVAERPARQSNAIFQSVYEWFGIHEREPEQIEFLAADGLLNCADEQGEFNHPVLLQRLELEFYPAKRTSQFVFRKRERPPELYLEFLRALPGADLRQIAQCADELKATEVSPFGGKDTDGFLQRLIQGVFPPSGQLIATEGVPEKNQLGESGERPDGGAGERNRPVLITLTGDRYELSDPDASKVTGPITPCNLESSIRRLQDRGWEPKLRNSAGPTIIRDPIIFMRRQQSGMSQVFDSILKDIATRTDFPAALLQIVGLTHAAPENHQEDYCSFRIGNEDEDVLLSKPANKEQLEIARQLARRDCVLVQGPPGTGKTHTIANLLGHLLAQGKSVLVTAHTPKALRVLRQKVVESLQPLCLSVLQNDKQSQEELQQSVKLIHSGLSQNDQLLEREAEKLKQARSRILGQLRKNRALLLDAIQDETREIVFGGVEIRPIDAAKRVKLGLGLLDWIPSPVKLGAVAPLSHAEAVTLYQTNAHVTRSDERELNANRPDVSSLPTPRDFSELLDEVALLKSQDLGYRADLWTEPGEVQQSCQFDIMLALATRAIEFLRDRTPWELDAIQAGRDGDEATRVWDSLIQLIEYTWQEVQDCQVLLMAHGPHLNDPRPPHELLPIVDDVIQHIEAGKSFGFLTKLTNPDWVQLISVTHIGNRSPMLDDPTHFRAVRALLRTKLVRQELVERWERQIATRGGPAAAALGERPELVCRQFVPQMQACIEWHRSMWLSLEAEFRQLGFGWSAYLQLTPPQTGNNAELSRLRDAVLGDLARILKARAGWLRLQHLEQEWAEWRALTPEADQADAAVTCRLRQAFNEGESTTYQECYEELIRLKTHEPDLTMRRNMLERLEQTAPAWASAIQNRHPSHSLPEPPGESIPAWEWRQLHDELERRADVSLEDLQQRIAHLSCELLDVTSQLVEKLTWVKLIRKVSTVPGQKYALGEYAKERMKQTKTGKGVQDAELRTAARRAMALAKGAVPVWIMPLSEVAVNFDPSQARFDVVIIDEASQCEPTAMSALYLGRQAIIVGDDEQVTPVAVGVEMQQVQQLREVHLQNIPAKALYDGWTSIYEFAEIAFGGVIRLVEHFRCAPDIIAFSNALSYNGEIRPLREASSISLSRHVLPYRVEGGRGRSNDEVNEPEAEAIASLICAAIEQPEYAKNADGKPMSFGVVSLVGDQQAMRVDALLRQHLESAAYKNRRILCGQAAQFQGDERDVMFLSLVDRPPPEPPLPMRQEGPKRIFKKRFNVAASRARDQMWVVHSLNHELDLKPGDYRRRLIEHAIDPEAWDRGLEKQLARVDPRSTVFEGGVLRHLMNHHFRVVPQYKVGSYRIDLVVEGCGKRLAVECDGERFHGPEKLQEDLERQAILERLGWQFARIRGSVFFRNEDRAMQPVFKRLAELGILPELDSGPQDLSLAPDVVTERVIRRAEELRSEWRANPSPITEAGVIRRPWRRKVTEIPVSNSEGSHSIQ